MRFFRIGVLVGICAWLLLVALPGPLEAVLADHDAAFEAALSDRGRGHYRAMAAHFREPFDGYGLTEVGVDEFAAIFLSNAALGFMNVGALDPTERPAVGALLDEVTRRALSPEVSPFGRDPREIRDFGDENLYLSHLALVLGARRRMGGDDRYDALHQRVVRHLVRRSLQGDGIARSYPGSARFPADQTATLAALRLYDLVHDTDLTARPLARYLAVMRARYTDRATGLPYSSTSLGFPHARTPRGCAMSFSLIYLAQLEPEEASAQYTAYRTHFLIHRGGLGGFREYPADRAGGMDGDSGPVVLGMGMAATGFGIGAARLHGDREAYRALSRTAATVGLPTSLSGERTYGLAPLLGEAILFHGETARRWDGARVEERQVPQAPLPVVPVALTALALTGTLLALRRAAGLVRAGGARLDRSAARARAR